MRSGQLTRRHAERPSDPPPCGAASWPATMRSGHLTRRRAERPSDPPPERPPDRRV